MYKKLEGFKKIILQPEDPRLSVEGWLPPEGKGYFYNLSYNRVTGEIKETEEIEETDILCRSVIKEEQYWERPKKPDNYDQKVEKEYRMQQSDPDYVDQELYEYREREWHRRKFGVWFYNNGKLEYITGTHYFFLAHWIIDSGYPRFRYPDLEYFYFLQYVIEDPLSKGMLEITLRRDGKTARSGVFLYEYTSRNRNANSGIQSKTEADAFNNVFGKFLVTPFKKLDNFWIPEYDTSKGRTPKKELRFFKANKRGKDYMLSYNPNSELESKIDARNSKVEAYDGDKLSRYVGDECGKMKDVDVYERHQTVQFCFEDNQTGRIIGKGLYTTTVEEVGGQPFRELVLDSMQNKRNSNGMTTTGLYVFFKPAYKGRKYDLYGYPDIEANKIFFNNNRADLAGDAKKLYSYVRKNPFTLEEALREDSEECVYDIGKLTERDEILESLRDRRLTERGNLVWKDGERDTEVVWQPDSNGRFHMAWHPQNPNQYRRIGERFMPTNPVDGVIGVDPYDHDKPKSGVGSSGCGAAYCKYNPEEVWAENFVMLYISRPPKARIFYEDMIKMCVFYGWKMLFEDNKQGIRSYFEDRGYEAFMMKDEKGNYGISATPKNEIMLMEETEAYIYDRVHKCVFRRAIKDWIEFDPNDTEKYDAAMATGWALVGARRLERKLSRAKRHVNLSDRYLRRYAISTSNVIE